MERRPLVIYHAQCADGFTAAYVAHQFFGELADYHAAAYQDPPPDVTGRDVVVLDFSYRRALVLEMAKIANSITILDHHKTARADLGDFPAPGSGHSLRDRHGPSATKVWAHFDMDKSGARLAWDYFYSGQRVPDLVQYVEDRDLNLFKLEDSEAINAYIFSHSYTWLAWGELDELLNDAMGRRHAMTVGAALLRRHRKDVEELVAALKHRAVVAGHLVWCANLPYTYSSDAGNLMAKGERFSACWWDTPKGRRFSLRSNDAGLDVSEIAARFGGGGHRNAAGFLIPVNEWPIGAKT